MSWSVVIEVAIGLLLLFSVLSIVCSAVSELIASALGLRARSLTQGIQRLLDSKEDADELFGHPLIEALYRSPKRRPSYIPPRKFAVALLDLKLPTAIGPAPAPTGDGQGAGGPGRAAVEEALASLPEGRLRKSLEVLWRAAEKDVTGFQRSVEGWFNDTMDRVSGWYRRRSQVILVVLGLAIAVGLNVNTVTVVQRLWEDAPLRNAVVEQARNAPPPDTGPREDFGDVVKDIEDGIAEVDRLRLPVGWSDAARPDTWYVAAIGWLLTGIALSFGAPFWFDLLNRMAGVRSAGSRPKPAEPPSATDVPRQP